MELMKLCKNILNKLKIDPNKEFRTIELFADFEKECDGDINIFFDAIDILKNQGLLIITDIRLGLIKLSH